VLCGRPAWSRPKSAREPPASRAGAAPLTQPLTGGSCPLEASPSSRHYSGELKLNAGEPSASAVGWASFSNSTRTHWGVQSTCYSLLLPLPAFMADGEANGANTGHCKRIERKPKGAWASGAHCDFNEAKSGDGVELAAVRRLRRRSGRVWSRTVRSGATRG
jgi:hypothetical protein